ncbi:hypothetical protein OZD68_04690 [Wolbachia endosymbiont of Drosophila bicornuta]|nr:hypothetical protein [Wolbachia endosymbiont of Drosophila bicornuta]MBA8755212.1 hypothetical protein [Wolbachia pipientis]MDE5056867.1 hypothetical protein [Wolbachia endosymbiont of Drosophila bicornuta]
MSVATRFFQLLCNKAIPVSRTGMTSLLLQYSHISGGKPIAKISMLRHDF